MSFLSINKSISKFINCVTMLNTFTPFKFLEILTLKSYKTGYDTSATTITKHYASHNFDDDFEIENKKTFTEVYQTSLNKISDEINLLNSIIVAFCDDLFSEKNMLSQQNLIEKNKLFTNVLVCLDLISLQLNILKLKEIKNEEDAKTYANSIQSEFSMFTTIVKTINDSNRDIITIIRTL